MMNDQASLTEPLLRLNIEDKTRPLMEQKREEVVTFIRE
jgi:phosphomannomutase